MRRKTLKQAQLSKIELCKLKAFEHHPYKVQDDAEMEALTESIRENGILTPLLVRPLNNRKGEYEVISGHRRMCAAEKAGLNTVPAFVSELNRADAVIMMVDSNLHREHLLPSEKAFAYKLKLEAMKQQGKRTDLTSRQDVDKSKSADQVSETESGRQVQRYIRLTYLLPELLRRVDEGKIALTPAVYLSYLSKQEQLWLVEAMEANDCTPSVSQAFQMKAESVAGKLTQDSVAALMCNEKANQMERLKIPMDRIRKYFPASYTNAQMEEEIVKMCEARFRKRTAMER
jgi:ParB family chromosome partitioning protein